MKVRAQRLSASEVFSPASLRTSSRSRGCSTPFGIRGILARWANRSQFSIRCAQRLSASEVFSPSPTPPDSLFSRGAQRLSASEVFSLGMIYQRRVTLACSTPFGIRGILASDKPQILTLHDLCSTPFGIRGILALFTPSMAGGTITCSTPFGIRGILAPSSESSSRALAIVLNAFRHQRYSRLDSPLLAVPPCLREGAQRLSASEVFSLR